MRITHSTAAKKGYVEIVFEEREGAMLREHDGRTMLVVSRPKKLTARAFRTQIRAAVRTARTHKLERLYISRASLLTKEVLAVFDEQAALRTVAENAVIANYEFAKYKTLKRDKPVAELMITEIIDAEDKAALAYGETVGMYVNHARDLANTPGGDMTPQVLAKGVQKLASGTRVAVKVLGVREIEKLKMGALLGVSRGSKEDPRFIIMEYWGLGKSAKGDAAKPIVFVGKGITFDTGGLNLKPSDAVLDMHLDMSGGAVVAAAITCAAKLGLKKNLIALIPAAENMVSGESYRPGDVLTTMKGLTVDVLNTDAEGRLVLSDALTYAERYAPRLVVDVATLTGAALVALGMHASAIMTKDETIERAMREYGEESGDYVWPLPLWDEYKQYTRGIHGDIANIPATGARYGGSINGGMFLSHFTDKYPWVHVDMAPRMTSVQSDYLAKGATGEPVRLLMKIAEKF